MNIVKKTIFAWFEHKASRHALDLQLMKLAENFGVNFEELSSAVHSSIDSFTTTIRRGGVHTRVLDEFALDRRIHEIDAAGTLLKSFPITSDTRDLARLYRTTPGQIRAFFMHIFLTIYDVLNRQAQAEGKGSQGSILPP